MRRTHPSERPLPLAPRRLLRPGGVYSFFNGLAPDNMFFHLVYGEIARRELGRWVFQGRGPSKGLRHRSSRRGVQNPAGRQERRRGGTRFPAAAQPLDGVRACRCLPAAVRGVLLRALPLLGCPAGWGWRPRTSRCPWTPRVRLHSSASRQPLRLAHDFKLSHPWPLG